MPLIAHRRSSKHKLTNCMRATILAVSKETLTVALEEGDVLSMPTKDFHCYWRVAFCLTSHQAQCITIREPFTIYDWDHHLMVSSSGERRGQYVAVSRGTCMSHVQIHHS